MVKFLRATGNALLIVAAIIGVLSALVWGATKWGYIKPLVVISGSMEPTIMTGDLIIARPHSTEDVAPGQVASIYSDVTKRIVTHRVVAINQVGEGRWEILMKGDANAAQDGGPYAVGATTWQPVVQIPRVGRWVATLSSPRVAGPLAVTLLALMGMALLPSAPKPRAEQPEATPPQPRRPADVGEAEERADNGDHIDRAKEELTR